MRMHRDERKILGSVALACVVLLLGLNATALAQEYGFDVWTTANGLPQNTVTGLAQTPDGYLWLSTFDGLARFDGVRFTIFDKGNTKGIVNNRFARLFADREGAVYAVTESNVVTVYRNGVFHSHVDFATGGEPIAAIVSDENGNIVFETVKGKFALQGDRLVLVSNQKEPNNEQNYRQIYWGKSGAKWVIEPTRITQQQNGHVTTYPLNLTAEELRASSSLQPYEDRQAALWVKRRLPAFELWRLQDGKVTVFTKKEIPALHELFPSQVMEDADGSLWLLLSGLNVPKPNQLVRFKDNQFTSYPLNEAVGAIASLVDREGNFWLATSTGLRRLRRKLITTLSVKDGLNSNEVYPLLQTANGAIFIGTALGVDMVHVPFNGGSALQAAVLRVKAPHLAAWTEARRLNAKRYGQLFADAGLRGRIVLPTQPDGLYHIFNQFVIRVPERNALKAFLDARGWAALALRRARRQRDTRRRGPGTRRPGTVGVLAPNTEMRIVDVATGADLGPDEDGELWVRGASVIIAQRILRGQDELTPEVLTGGRVTAAFLSPEGRPRRQPAGWAERFTAIMNGETNPC